MTGIPPQQILDSLFLFMTTQTLPSVHNIPWTADCGDGHYRNPVLFADYSDPDVVRVGGDFWMTASSFSHAPGLPILHSRDLVNWTLVGHALPALVPQEHFSQPRHGQGVWAPSIRHHAGKFWIFYPDPDFGIYVITTDDPRGRWSDPIMVKAGKGLIDPCPLWDDDGQVYLVHGWARSRSGINNQLTVHKLSADATRVVDEGKVIIDGNKMPGWHTIEGPKFHKRNGWYYVLAPAGGVAEGYQAVFRSRKIDGPYEARNVMDRGGTAINGPHQGAWVETAEGEHWFFHFQELPAYGRVVHLQPMRWLENDWPVIGIDPDGDERGEPVVMYKKPALPAQGLAVPAMSDDFTGDKLAAQWQWQANPKADWATINAEAGVLTLRCVPQPAPDSHWNAAHLLMQKFPAPAFTATVCIQFRPISENDSAGLMVFGYDYAWLGLVKHADGIKLVIRGCEQAQKGGLEKDLAEQPVDIASIFLRVHVNPGAGYEFSFSSDGETFKRFGGIFKATSSMWVGAKVGLFASAAAGGAPKGAADFSAFELTL
ncbi:MAG: glycoside hydrolase 43 family protein [Nibricoccus sp.]